MAGIILFWCFENINFLGRIMEFKFQFWHPSDLRLCHLCKNWLMTLKCPLLLNMHSKKNQQNYWPFYPSEPFTFGHFNVRHPVASYWYTRAQNVCPGWPVYEVKQPQEKWACDFHDDAPPLSFQLQVTEDFF